MQVKPYRSCCWASLATATATTFTTALAASGRPFHERLAHALLAISWLLCATRDIKAHQLSLLACHRQRQDRSALVCRHAAAVVANQGGDIADDWCTWRHERWRCRRQWWRLNAVNLPQLWFLHWRHALEHTLHLARGATLLRPLRLAPAPAAASSTCALHTQGLAGSSHTVHAPPRCCSTHARVCRHDRARRHWLHDAVTRCLEVPIPLPLALLEHRSRSALGASRVSSLLLGCSHRCLLCRQSLTLGPHGCAVCIL